MSVCVCVCVCSEGKCQMQSLESDSIVWQESTPPQLDSTTTIGIESGAAVLPIHHMMVT